jgi:methylthioribose-1-phosphate isomerase
MRVNGKEYRTVWMDGGRVMTIDQQALPHRFEVVELKDHREAAKAIREMTVRGAPAIGAVAALGLAQVYREAPSEGAQREAYVTAGFELLRATRPTAQNLFHALERVRRAAEGVGATEQAEAALAEAGAMIEEDVEACRLIGEVGEVLIGDGARVLTHCNAGWVACVDWGTALAPIYVAHRAGRGVKVFADETRPRGQGAKLTAWELMQEGVPVEVVADNAAGWLMRRGEVDLVIVGTDRVAANGDVANKIGTYEKALCARANGVPFYVAVPDTTFDPACPNGEAIPIEERDGDELLYAEGLTPCGNIRRVRVAPEGATARNPAFDVTPAELVTGLITRHGVIEASAEGIGKVLNLEKPKKT